jgi:hypothetical protein
VSNECDSQIIELPNNDDSQIIEFPKIFYNERLQLAHKAWRQGNDAISIAKVSNTYNISKSTLQDHINDAILKTEVSQKMQLLFSKEEEALAF